MAGDRQQIRRLMIAINRIDEMYYGILRVLGVRGAAFVLFYALADGRPASQKKICQEWAIPKTTLNTLVQEYLQKGYVRLVSTGHREKQIVLTQQGAALAQRILTPLFCAEENAMEPFLKTGLAGQMECVAQRLEKEFDKIKREEGMPHV